MHPAHSTEDLLKRYPDLPKEHAVFMVGLYNDIQARISEFRVSQMDKVTTDGEAWRADIALAHAASGLQEYIGEIMDRRYKP
ncbi:MAG: hypothetical protein ACSHX3_16065 [Litorimonas sp.]|uniref:hypothetical protein n=1 Tax=Roseibium sp. AS2 TaxID=3135781 RepID=UPI00319DCA22